MMKIHDYKGFPNPSRIRIALAGMRYLDQVLAPQPYLAGERFTMADITAFAGLAYADIASIEVPADLVRLKAWRARVAERPSVAHA